MDQFVQKYIEEANEILSKLEEYLLIVEENPHDAEIINEIFRLMHTLKGGGAMFGFSKITDVTHELESIYDFIRNGKAEISKELLDNSLDTIDYVKYIIELDNQVEKNTHSQKLQKLIDLRNKYDGEQPTAPKNATPATQENTTTPDSKIKTYKVFFKPNIDILKNGTDPLLLVRELSELGEAKIIAITDFVANLNNLKYDDFHLCWVAIIAVEDKNSIHDVFIFIEEEATIEVEQIHNGNLFKDKSYTENKEKFLEKIITATKNKCNKILDSSTNDQQTPTEPENTTENTTENTEDTTEDTTENTEDTPKKQKKKQNADSIVTNFKEKSSTISSLRISASKVDILMNLISELITTQARLAVYVEEKDSENPHLEIINESFQKLSRQLRDITYHFSMIPLKSIIVRFQRLIRDLSTQLDKDVEFKTEGTSTELDKRIIENLIDPIMHLLRNSLDHGIETKKERAKTQKKPKATIFLNAYYSGTNVYIEIGDDGRGIDVKKIRQSAINKGFIEKNTKHTDNEIINTIFEPGFSTSTTVSELSGRGVGLDVVKRKISELRGDIKIASKPGQGTTFIISLPLTLSIIDGLLVLVGNNKYIIPLNLIEKIYSISKKDLQKSHYNILILDQVQIPYYHLKEEFNEKYEEQNIEQVIVIRYEGKLFAIIVDKILGEHQAVLKPLGKLYRQQQIFSGATILGDGSIALVIDAKKIIDKNI